MSINTNPLYQQQALETMRFVSIEHDTQFPAVTTNSGNQFNKTAQLVYDVSTSQTNGLPFGVGPATDAFGRLRVSVPFTLIDSKQIYDKAPNTFDEVVVGAASSTFVANDALTLMSTASSGSYVIRQTPRRFNYQPGKSLVGIFTGVLNPEDNIVKRVGLFHGLSAAPYSPVDGIYFEASNGTMSVVVQKVSGAAVTASIPQSAWNIDKMDGTGASQLSADWSKAQIFTIDYEWLGAGKTRFGCYLNGRPYTVHEVTHFNELSTAYTSVPNFPIRYEIRQTGAGSGSMKHICSTVMIEGGSTEQILGQSYTTSTSAAVNCNTDAYYLVLAIRNNPANPDLVNYFRAVELLNTSTNGDGIYKLILNPTYSSSPTWSNINSSSYVQTALGNGTITLTGGVDLVTRFVPRGQGAATTAAEGTFAGLDGSFGVKIDGTPETIAIACRGISNSAAIWAAINLVQRA